MWGPLEERLAGNAPRSSSTRPEPGARRPPRWPLSISDFASSRGRAPRRARPLPRSTCSASRSVGSSRRSWPTGSPSACAAWRSSATACGWGSKPGTIASLALISMPVRYHSRTRLRAHEPAPQPGRRGARDRLPHLTDARLRYPPPLLGYGYQMMAGMFWSSLTWLHTVQVPDARPGRRARPLIPPANGVQLARLLPERPAAHPRRGGSPVRSRPGQPEPPAAAGLLRRGASSATSPAWSTGRVVDDDAEVEEAFRDSIGAQPHGVLSDAYRHLVRPHYSNQHSATR